MTPDEILVVLGGIAAIVWVNWYFLIVGRRGTGATRMPADGRAPQEAAVKDEFAGDRGCDV